MRRPRIFLHSFSIEYFEFFSFSLLIETVSFWNWFEPVFGWSWLAIEIRLSISLLELELGDAWTEDCTSDCPFDSDGIKDDCWSFLDFFRFRFFSSTFNFFSLTLTASPSITWVFPDATKCRHLFVLWNSKMLTIDHGQFTDKVTDKWLILHFVRYK